MKVFNIKSPTNWAELTDKQLLMVFHLFARDLSAAEVKALCLMKWNHLKVLATLPRHRFLIKRGKEQVVLKARQIQQATSVLDFLDSFAPMPIRIARIGKHRALPADFEKVPFEQYLYVDNLFQGYLNTQQDELLLQMAQILYGSDHVKPTKAHLVGIFYWMASLKQYFASLFSNFYKPAPAKGEGNLLGSSQPDIYSQLRDSTNAMIRALTGGDITKEERILKMDTWRALTELDAKAKEAEELRKAYKKP
ncbi:hypothetical protein [Xylanibacter ruminicola]|nr:hypothetical protein [Xylanibacter ruminicola]